MVTIALAALLALLLVNAPARAQREVDFRPSDHLEGFDEADFSEYRELYGLEAYRIRTGERLSFKALEELRTQWRQNVEQVRAKIQALEADPSAYSRFRHRRRLESDVYFSRLHWDTIVEEEDFWLMAQMPANAGPAYARRIQELCAAPVREACKWFHQQWAAPADLECREHRRCIGVMILASDGDYQNYWKAHANRGTYTAGSHYLPEFHLVVSVLNGTQPMSALQLRRALLYGLGHALVHSYTDGSLFAPRAYWWQNGFALHLSGMATAEGTGFDPATRCANPVSFFAPVACTPSLRSAIFLPLEQLFEVKSTADVRDRLADRLQSLDLDAQGQTETARATLEAECAVLFDARPSGPASDPLALQRSILAEITGQGAPGALRSLADEAEGLRPLERRMWRQMHAQLTALGGKSVPNESEEDFVKSAEAIVDSVRAAEIAAASRAKATPLSADRNTSENSSDSGMDPRLLLEFQDPVPALLARALFAAGLGRLAQAEALLRSSEDPTCAREAERLAATMKRRHEIVQSLVGSKTRIKALVQGESVSGTVLQCTDDGFELEAGRGSKTMVPWSAFDLAQVVRLQRQSPELTLERWEIAHLGMLNDQKNWSRSLRGDDPQCTALLGDAELLDRAAANRGVIGPLETLAALGTKVDETQSRLACATVKELFGQYPEHPWVTEHRDTLELLTRRCLAVQAAALSLEELLPCATITIEEDGRTRVEYDFTDAAALADFDSESQPDLLAPWTAALRIAPEAHAVIVRRGMLQIAGRRTLRHRLVVTAPFEIEVDLVSAQGLLSAGTMHTSNYSSLFLGEDPPGGWFSFFMHSGFDVRRPGSSVREWTEGASRNDWVGDQWSVTLKHDGAQITRKDSAWIEERAPDSTLCGGVVRGSFGFLTNSEVVMGIDRLRITGTFEIAGQNALRERWCDEQLHEWIPPASKQRNP